MCKLKDKQKIRNSLGLEILYAVLQDLGKV